MTHEQTAAGGGCAQAAGAGLTAQGRAHTSAVVTGLPSFHAAARSGGVRTSGLGGVAKAVMVERLARDIEALAAGHRGTVSAAAGAYAAGHPFHGNQHVKPEDFGMARMK